MMICLGKNKLFYLFEVIFLTNYVENALKHMKEDIDYEEREEFEKKNPLWIKYHLLVDAILNKEIELREALKDMLQLALVFLENYRDEEELEDIIIGFENMATLLLVAYGQKGKEIHENDFEGDILSYFNSFMFERDYKKEIKELIAKLKDYCAKIGPV